MAWLRALIGALALGLAAGASSQETRMGEDGFASPPATHEQVDWLIGQWSGDGIGGAPAMESWLPPSGPTMVGTFVQTKRGDDGSEDIMFTEHMYLMEEEGTLVLRLKHFNADLTGWEEKDGMLTFRLVAIEECVAYFHALTLRCDGENGLVAAVRMKSDKLEPQELVFRFKRSEPPAKAAGCPNATTTLEINECLSALLEKADNRRVIYRQAAIERHGERPELTAAIVASEKAFDPYREAECDGVYENWKEGSIRYTMALTCKIELTDRRTHTIWRNWLTFMDSTAPVLPEPRPTG